MRSLARYDYRFPPELVARAPAHPRDTARLLVYNRKTNRVALDVFKNIGRHLPPRSLLVLNETKVIPARLTLQKPTGGLVRVLYLGHDRRHVRVLADRRLTPLTPLTLSGESLANFPLKIRGTKGGYSFVVVRRTPAGHYLLKPSFPTARILDVLTRHGATPLPPYIKNTPLDETHARKEYQSVFARTPGSVAAPTASLHFTKRLLRELRRQGNEIAYLTLHVNLGTFAPVTDDQLRRGRLHAEHFTVPHQTSAAVNRAKRAGRPIIAVGTTVVRALESKRSPTTLFIRPGFRSKTVTGIITNFHVPRSSLLMLVAAMTGRSKLLTLYHHAIRNRFRLFSFGDAMLIT